MRKCIRCETEMVEDCDLKVEAGACGLTVSNNTNRLFSGNIGRPNVAICPECGEISIYLQNTDGLKIK